MRFDGKIFGEGDRFLSGDTGSLLILLLDESRVSSAGEDIFCLLLLAGDLDFTGGDLLLRRGRGDLESLLAEPSSLLPCLR